MRAISALEKVVGFLVKIIGWVGVSPATAETLGAPAIVHSQYFGVNAPRDKRERYFHLLTGR